MTNTLIKISHRGNTIGPSSNENEPKHIKFALKTYDVEIDVWWKDGFWLGHDKPTYKVDQNFLRNPKLWCHAKNMEALVKMRSDPEIHCFFHGEDDATLTSRGHIWCFPGKEIPGSIVNQPEWFGNLEQLDLTGYEGVCSDYIDLVFDLLVTSIGGVGSSFFLNFLNDCGVNSNPNRFRPGTNPHKHAMSPPQAKNIKKAIFIYGNPYNAVLSIQRRCVQR